jgi:hypothetical protein
MASHGMSWTLGAHAHLGSLDFLVTTDESMARAPTPVRPPRSDCIDAVIEALKKLQLHALEALVPRGDQLLDFNYVHLERQLSIFLGL